MIFPLFSKILEAKVLSMGGKSGRRDFGSLLSLSRLETRDLDQVCGGYVGR